LISILALSRRLMVFICPHYYDIGECSASAYARQDWK
jgi:hypothetical protein